MRAILVMTTALLLAGCGKSEQSDKEGAPRKESRATQVTRETVSTLTQYDKIKVGKSTAERFKKANAAHKKDLEDVGQPTK